MVRRSRLEVFSSVYLALNGKEKSAIKVLQRSRWESFAGSQKTTVPSDNEILCLLQCVHPNIVPLMTSLVTYNAVYIEMPYLPKGDLCKHLMRQGPYCDAEARALGSEILTALLYVQSHDVMHRDIKPDNILCTGLPSPLALKLIDFGLSRRIRTGCRTICGTPSYMAPELHTTAEQFPSPGYRTETDAWSFGIVYFLFHFGESPFDLDDRHNPDFSTM